MFSLRNFIKGGLLKAIGNMADYQVILNAAGWLEKGVLDESDLAEIQAVIEAREATVNAPEEIVDSPEESAESTTTE